MKCSAVILICVSLVYGGGVRNELEENLLVFFEMWLKGDPNLPLPLPQVDVIRIPKLEGTFKDGGIKLSYATSDMNLSGLPQAYFHELDVAVSDTKLMARGVLVGPSLSLTAEKYKLDGRAFFLYPIKGEGEMCVNFQNCTVLFDLGLGTNGKSMWVEKLQFGVQVDQIMIDLTGTSNFIKNIINGKATSLFASYHEDIEIAMSEASIPLINYYLKNTSSSQLLHILKSQRVTGL